MRTYEKILDIPGVHKSRQAVVTLIYCKTLVLDVKIKFYHELLHYRGEKMCMST